MNVSIDEKKNVYNGKVAHFRQADFLSQNFQFGIHIFSSTLTLYDMVSYMQILPMWFLLH